MLYRSYRFEGIMDIQYALRLFSGGAVRKFRTKDRIYKSCTQYVNPTKGAIFKVISVQRTRRTTGVGWLVQELAAHKIVMQLSMVLGHATLMALGEGIPIPDLYAPPGFSQYSVSNKSFALTLEITITTKTHHRHLPRS